MKLTASILLISCLHVFANGYGQESVTLNEKGATLVTIFEKIEKQTGTAFWFRNDQLEKAKPVTIQLDKVPITEALDKIFKGQPFTYTIKDKTVYVTPREDVANNQQPIPPIDIRGRVVNERGDPMEGVTVRVKGSNKASMTDGNGEFSILAADNDAVLIFTHVSMETFEVKVKGKNDLSISLKSKVSALDELQVIAYGTSTKRLNTGNVSVVKSTEIEQQPVSNPLLTLAGRIPGMEVTQQTGVPGGNVKVEIRGRNSIANGNDPLYIIDGVPYAPQLLPNNGNSVTQGSSPFNFISPSNIESITVLKDADATSIYGSRGANGVVLITTKKGKSGETRINANVYAGGGKIARKAKLLNTQQYLETRKEAFINDNATPSSYDYDVNGTWDSTSYIDWQDQLIGGTAQYKDAQVSISGGNTNTQYLIGGGYHHETTVFPGDAADKKASVYFNINSASSNQRFKIMLSGNYVADNNTLPYIDLTGSIYMAPNSPAPYKADGSLNWDIGDDWGNPVSPTVAKYKSSSNTIVGNSVISYKVLPDVEIKSNFGYTKLTLDDHVGFPTYYFPPSYNIKNGTASFSHSSLRTWIVEPQIVFEKTIGRHKFNTIVGTSFQESENVGEIINASGYNNNDLLGSLAGAGTISKGTITNTQYKYNSVFGRINYKFNDRYILNLTGRRDGSSRFGPGKQFANFGSVGAAWIFSTTKFVQDKLSFLNFGKLRASYGSTGNDQIPDYLFQELYNFFNGLAYQGSSGLLPANLSNPDYAWEVNKKLEFGAELGLLRDKIYLSASYYQNRSSNQLVGYKLSDVTGFTSIQGNLPAVVENKGWEFVINTTNVKTQRFSWTSSFNISIARNKLVSYPKFELSPYYVIYAIGQPLNISRVYDLIGVDTATGVYEFRDSKGNETFAPNATEDKSTIVDLTPKYYGGFQNTIKYGNFQLDFLFQFVKQKGMNYLFSNTYAPGMGSGYYNPPVEVLDRWKKPGDVKPYQTLTQDFGSAAYSSYSLAVFSNYAYSDASFIRLKNVALSYEFNPSLIQKMHLRNLKLYVNAQNLITITNYIGLDPENKLYSALPPLRVITAGIQVGL